MRKGKCFLIPCTRCTPTKTTRWIPGDLADWAPSCTSFIYFIYSSSLLDTLYSTCRDLNSHFLLQKYPKELLCTVLVLCIVVRVLNVHMFWFVLYIVDDDTAVIIWSWFLIVWSLSYQTNILAGRRIWRRNKKFPRRAADIIHCKMVPPVIFCCSIRDSGYQLHTLRSFHHHAGESRIQHNCQCDGIPYYSSAVCQHRHIKLELVRAAMGRLVSSFFRPGYRDRSDEFYHARGNIFPFCLSWY